MDSRLSSASPERAVGEVAIPSKKEPTGISLRETWARLPGDSKSSTPSEAVQRSEQFPTNLGTKEPDKRDHSTNPTFQMASHHQNHVGVFGCEPKSRTSSLHKRVKERIGNQMKAKSACKFSS